MKKLALILSFLLLPVFPAFALDIDLDNNSAIDIGFGGTNSTTAADARDALGLEIGVDIQGYDVDLDTYAGITPSADAQGILGAADYSAMRTLLSLVPGTDIQTYNAELDTLAAPTAWSLYYVDGDGSWARLALGASGTFLKSAGASAAPGWDAVAGSGGGTIGGTLGSTDNAILRADGTGGLTAQGSSATISDAGTLNIPTGQTYNINGTAHTHNYQAADADLTTYAGITPSANVQSLLGTANYAAMRTLLDLEVGTDFNAYDADLAALAGLSGVRGDVIYRDATQWQRLAKGASGKVLKMGADDPFWGDDNNDGLGGVSSWDEINDSAANLALAHGTYTSNFTSELDSAGAVWTLTNTLSNITATISFMDFKYATDGANSGYFLRGYDNSGADLKWYVGPDGAFYGSEFSTAQTTSGGSLDLLEAAANGTDYMTWKADDDVGTNRLIALSSSVADSEDLTITLGANDNTGTIASTTGLDTLTFTGIGIVADSFNGHTFTAGSSTFTGTAGQTYTFPATTSTIAAVTAPIALASQAAGDLFYATDSDSITRLAKGTTGQLLAMKGDETGPEWIAAPAGTGDFKADGTVPMTAAPIPNAVNTIALGSAAAEWADLYLGDGAVIYGQNDQTNTLTSSAAGWTAALDFTVGGGDLTLAAAGVKLTGSNGSLTILGLGDGQDEDLKIDLNTTADTIGVSSPASSATAINFGTLNLATTGTVSGAIPINSDANGMSAAEMTTAGMYGTFYFATGAGTWALPGAAAGMSICVYSTTAAAVVINPDDGDTIVLNGTALAAGDSITSGSVAGDFISLVAKDANTWYTVGRSGTWTDTN